MEELAELSAKALAGEAVVVGIHLAECKGGRNYTKAPGRFDRDILLSTRLCVCRITESLREMA